MAAGQDAAGVFAGLMDGNTVDHRIRTGKIDIFENAVSAGLGPTVVTVGMDPVFIDGQDLTRFDIPLKDGSDSIEGAVFRSDHDGAVFAAAVAERMKTMGISGADQLFCAHQDERVGSVQTIHGLVNGCLDRRGMKAGLGYDISNDLGIGSRVENSSVKFQLLADVISIG